MIAGDRTGRRAAVSVAPRASASRAVADPGRERFLLAFVWCPAGQEDHLEGRGDAVPVTPGKPRHRGALLRERAPEARRVAACTRQGVGLAHRAQIGESGGRRSRRSRSFSPHPQPAGRSPRAATARQDRGSPPSAARAAKGPPVNRLSASASAARSSDKVRPPNRTPRNSPSGFSARRHWTSWPTGSFAQCSESAWITRSCAPGSSARTSSSADDPGVGQDFGPGSGKSGHDGRCRKRFVNLAQSLLDLGGGLFVQEQLRALLQGAGAIAAKGGAVGEKGGADMMGETRVLRAGMQSALALLFPPQCISCGEPTTSDFGLCGACWRETPFISGLVCDRCGTPLPGEDEGRAEYCDDCMTLARPWVAGAIRPSLQGQWAQAGAGAQAWRPARPGPAGGRLADARGRGRSCNPTCWWPRCRSTGRGCSGDASISRRCFPARCRACAGFEHCPDLLVRARAHRKPGRPRPRRAVRQRFGCHPAPTPGAVTESPGATCFWSMM